MASAVNGLSSLAASTTAPPQSSTAASQSTGTSGSAPTEQMFLQLLVAQMKNQDPESPSDPTQFVSELAQFSQLEQVIAIRSDIENATGQTTGAATNPSTTPNATQNNNTNQTPTAAQNQK